MRLKLENLQYKHIDTIVFDYINWSSLGATKFEDLLEVNSQYIFHDQVAHEGQEMNYCRIPFSIMLFFTHSHVYNRCIKYSNVIYDVPGIVIKY